MRVLVIGSGGREHALAWGIAQSERVRQVFVAPGNAGTEWAAHTTPNGWRVAACSNVAIGAGDIDALLNFAREQQIALTVVGPEAPLAAGIVDRFTEAHLKIFGPTAQAAMLETSKAFAKQFMRDSGIPTPEFGVFEEYDEACRYIEAQSKPLVVKADGLAAGKGVIVCGSREQALDAVKTILLDKAFGAAGARVIIEERLEGEELSVLAFTDGSEIAVMPFAADHKRAYDGDHGPNTGGMGAYAPRQPNPKYLQELNNSLNSKILRRVITRMADNGTPYTGVLYAGLMLTANGPYVLEFNCRFGDPETQAIIPLLESDLVDVLLACVDWELNKIEVKWKDAHCAAVVCASSGYPGEYLTGFPIGGLDQISGMRDVQVFHAGTASHDNQVITIGGRVLAVSALGTSLDHALDRAYAAVGRIHFEGMHFRKDIGRTMRESGIRG